jgi:hypothetical protein
VEYAAVADPFATATYLPVVGLTVTDIQFKELGSVFVVQLMPSVEYAAELEP